MSRCITDDPVYSSTEPTETLRVPGRFFWAWFTLVSGYLVTAKNGEGIPSNMLSTLICEVLAFVFVFLYSSFFEWWFHKYLFHSPRIIKATFKAHALVHHQRYKYEKTSYEWQEGQEKDHIAMDWFSLPLFVGFHLPFLILIQWATGIPSVWGGVAAITAYYTIYEYFHYCMHVPANRAFETNRVFLFVKEHHRIHHKYMQQNLNVFFPLADKCFGTYRSAASVPAAKSPDGIAA